jgi:hypothetical protein
MDRRARLWWEDNSREGLEEIANKSGHEGGYGKVAAGSAKTSVMVDFG